MNSEISRDIHTLELAGFLSRDYQFSPGGAPTKKSHLRVKDNYLRFFYSVVLKNKMRIEKGGIKIKSLFQLPAFSSILGLQFENLILANRELIYPLISLEMTQIRSAAPYIQKKTTKNRGGCQIDLLIESTLDVFYLCEFKCKKQIDPSIIAEVKRKAAILQLPKHSAIKPVLIFAGELYPSHRETLESYFYKLISLDEIMQ